MIEVRNLSKTFGRKQVLFDISVHIDEGETFAIIGRSGSGKSVLMKHMIGILKPSEGHVLVDDADINDLPYDELRELRQRFGVLFQGGALFDSMSAFDNVAFPLRNFTKMTKAEINDRAMECLEMVQLEDIGNKGPAELSGGMQKRVALARAIALNPDYIFYDEPTSGLDPLTSGTINDLINDIADQVKATSIVITHDMNSVLAIADRTLFIHEGHAHWIGSIAELHHATDLELTEFVKASEYKIGV